ncbi:MAG: hypothetical protein QW103_03085, partial [Candidatus Pacearchaeota archaeon]
DWYRGLNRAIKSTILWVAGGVKVVSPHVLIFASKTNPPELKQLDIYGFDFNYRGPHPKTSAFLMTSYWLNNATFIEKRILNNEVFFYGFRRNNGENIVFVWAKEGTTKQLKDNTLDARDIYGKKVKVSRLGEEPVIFYSNTKNISEIMNDVQNNLV